MNHQPTIPNRRAAACCGWCQASGRSSPERPLDYWDAVPRDGPAVFVANTDLLDLGIIHGRWIDPRQPEPILRDQLVTALGGQVVQRRAWAVIDQINVGEAMLPEDVSWSNCIGWSPIGWMVKDGRYEVIHIYGSVDGRLGILGLLVCIHTARYCLSGLVARRLAL